MYAFGMLGSYFSQGVYAVAGPFQGAVDIIVVQQEDGSFKSSPWYVKCGDFQGVLTRGEKIVDISVNGIPADFYMLLNSRGEAYFEKEAEDPVLALPSPLSFDTKDKEQNEKLYSSDSSSSQTGKRDSQAERILHTSTQGSTNSEKRSELHDSTLQGHPENSGCQSSGSPLNQPIALHVENDVKYATKDAACGRDDSSLIETDQVRSHRLMIENTSENSKPSDFDVEVKPVVINVSGENLILAEADSIFLNQEPLEESQQCGWSSATDSSLQSSQRDGNCPCPSDEASNANASTSGMDDAMLYNFGTVIAENWFSLQDASSFESHDKDTSQGNGLETSDAANTMGEPMWNDYKVVTAEEGRDLNNSLRTDSVLDAHMDVRSLEPGLPLVKSSGPSDSSVLSSDVLADDLSSSTAVAVTEDGIPVQNINGETRTDGVASEKDVICRVDDNALIEGSKAAEVAVVPAPSRWTMWPLSFRRSKGEKAAVSEAAARNQALVTATNIAVGSPFTEEILRKNGYNECTQKPKPRSYVPTSAQIESLKLNDGPNKVTFTFPRVLGRTQVDANIYLWKWNTRIVISDVDGTITKSDVLGQFMPLVGRDWSQSGVTRLFSAIKENGYEVLFLSARAISQAYLTRQFLINLKQDGETLPEGPVFISPDGLIPSLYREVVRRAPHEFKISCLEGIRRLFPDDVNPFYAGFGNRDTDEISYLKVGIPKGKIFIINPKGEVMVNHHVDVKSYTSIHALVDDMFPPVSSSEQEDFNSWNYWKLPLPDVDDELRASAKNTKVKKGTVSKR